MEVHRTEDRCFLPSWTRAYCIRFHMPSLSLLSKEVCTKPRGWDFSTLLPVTPAQLTCFLDLLGYQGSPLFAKNMKMVHLRCLKTDCWEKINDIYLPFICFPYTSSPGWCYIQVLCVLTCLSRPKLLYHSHGMMEYAMVDLHQNLGTKHCVQHLKELNRYRGWN